MKPMFMGNASAARRIIAMFSGPGVQVDAKVPVAGPVPPPSIVVVPAISASSICCGQMKWMCVSTVPGVTIKPSAAMISVPGPMTMSTPGITSGLPALPIAAMREPFSPMSALTMPQWSTISAFVITQSQASIAPGPLMRCDWPMPSRIVLPPPNFTSSP